MRLKDSSLKQRVALGLVCVLIVSYTVYHLAGLFGAEISTYAAGVTTESTVFNYNGYVFRDETVLNAEQSGIVDYMTKNGTKVSKGQALATVYEQGTKSTQDLIRRIDSRIAILEESADVAVKSLDMGEMKQSVSDTYYTLIKMLASGETGGLAYQTDKFLIGLNRVDAISQGENASVYETLEGLRAYKAELLGNSGSGNTYYAQASGYFYTAVDGYESYFTMEAVENLTGKSFYDLLSMTPSSDLETQNSYGKIGYDSEWKLVLPIALEEQKYFDVGGIYSAMFEENNQTELPLTVERIIEVPEHETALLIMASDRLPENFTFNRCQNVRLEVDSVSGIYVPKNIVERTNGYRGVYILRGSVVHFRYIEILYEGSDYYLVEEGVEDEEDRTYLKVNDLIILNGKNMFDGRVLD